MPSSGGTTEIQRVTLPSGEVRYRFQWWNWRSVETASGIERRREKTTESKHTRSEAESLRKSIIGSHSRGELWVPSALRPVARLRDVVIDYAASARSDATSRFRTSMANRFLAFTGDQALVSQLSMEVLREYAASLRGELKAIDRYVGEVERLWTWAHKRKISGVPEPCRIVGDEVFRPPPVYAMDSPRWADMDMVIGHLKGWHHRAALVLRYQGIRPSQALTLDSADLDLDRLILRLRADARGAKGAQRHRVVPLHPALAVELRSWGIPASGPIFMSVDPRRKEPGPWREDALVEPFTRAWKLAGVPETRWGAPKNDPGGRVHARPAHAFRGGVKTELLRSEIPQVIVDLLIGHTTSATEAAYVPLGDPTAHPLWPQMVAAVGKIPRVV